MTETKKNIGIPSTYTEVPIKWDSAENLTTIYANQVLISHSGPEFYLVFGEVITPATQGNLNDSPPEEMSVKPVVKLAIPHSMMISIANIISENVNNFITKTVPPEE